MRKLRSLPLSLKIFTAFMLIAGCLIFIFGAIYYVKIRGTILETFRELADASCNTAVHDFNTLYSHTLSQELKVLEKSAELNTFLVAAEQDKFFYRSAVERMFLDISAAGETHLSVRFLDENGREQVILEGRKRIRHYNRYHAANRETELFAHHLGNLFRRMKKENTGQILFSPPFTDKKNRPGFLMAIVKQEPEAGGFGGAIVKHCDLSIYIAHLARVKVHDIPVLWLYDNKETVFLSPGEGSVRPVPDKKDTTIRHFAQCRVSAGAQPLLTVLCSVPPSVVSKELQPVVWYLMTIFIILLAASFIGALMVSRFVSRPIKKLAEATRNLCTDTPDLNFPHSLTESGGEIGILGTAFEGMTQRLKQTLESLRKEIAEHSIAEEKLKQHHTQLEELVTARTNEIEEANKKIQKESRSRVQIEEQRKILVDELERVNTELQDFAHIVSHDLKTPLRGISSLAKWLSEDYAGKLGTDGKQYVDKLMIRTRRMNNLIDGILKYSKIGRVKAKPEYSETDSVVKEIIDSMSVPEGIEIRIEESLPLVVYDKVHLSQVFQNLISNAVSYMGKPEGEIVISHERKNEFLEFSVRDTGIGIEEKHFERIFKIFQSLKPTSESESTGIGLSLVKKIVSHSGGKIWVESTVGIGSSFYFTIPIKTTDIEAPDYNVLIIDDSMEFIKVAAAMLEARGHKTLYATSGDEAYRLLDAHKDSIHVTLFDVDIPDEDALTRYRSLRRMRPNMRIVVCTGAELYETVELLKQEGVDGVLSKPFTINELDSRIISSTTGSSRLDRKT
ncbi:MAG: response regulator [bacterium]|nr:response regulator [bacterium]